MSKRLVLLGVLSLVILLLVPSIGLAATVNPGPAVFVQPVTPNTGTYSVGATLQVRGDVQIAKLYCSENTNPQQYVQPKPTDASVYLTDEWGRVHTIAASYSGPMLEKVDVPYLSQPYWKVWIYVATDVPIDSGWASGDYKITSSASWAAAPGCGWAGVDATTLGQITVNNPDIPKTTIPLKAWEFPMGSWYQPFLSEYQYGSNSWGSAASSSSYGYYRTDESRITGTNYYGQKWHLFWRVIKSPDGTEQIIDSYLWDGHQATSSQQQNAFYSWSNSYSGGSSWGWQRNSPMVYFAEQSAPAKTISLSGGPWLVETWYAVIPTPVVARYPNLTKDSVVEWWEGNLQMYYQYSDGGGGGGNNYNYAWNTYKMCTNVTKEYYQQTGDIGTPVRIQTYFSGYQDSYSYPSVDDSCENHGLVPVESLGCNYNWQSYTQSSSSYSSQYYGRASYSNNDLRSCWIEQKTESNVKIEDKAELLDAVLIGEWPSDDGTGGLSQPERQAIFSATGGPFDSDTGVAQEPDNDTAAQATLITLLGIGALGGGIYAMNSYKSGNLTVRNIVTSASKKIEDTLAAQRAFMEQKKKEWQEWLAEQERIAKRLKQQKDYAAAVASQQQRADQFQTDLAKAQNSKNLADAGSAYALLATKYSDILSTDGKKQLMAASTQAWKLNNTATATATFSPAVMAKLPDSQPSIANENGWDKISRGWGYAAGNLWDGIAKFAGDAGNAIGGAIDSAIKNPVGTLKNVATNTLGAAVYLGSGRAAMDLGNLVVNGAIAYGKALQEDPWGTLAKTAIVVGGIALAIPSGGTSLLVAGAALTAVGAGALIVNDSYRFANATSESELHALGNKSSEDIVWVGGAAVSLGSASLSLRAASTLSDVKSVSYVSDATLEAKAGAGTRGATITSWYEGSTAVEQEVLVSNSLTKSQQYAVRMHELYGEVPKTVIDQRTGTLVKQGIDVANGPEVGKLLQKYGMTWDMYGEQLAADVISSKIAGKGTFVALRESFGQPNWWKEYPGLVKLVNAEIPTWWKAVVPMQNANTIVVGGEIGMGLNNTR